MPLSEQFGERARIPDGARPGAGGGCPGETQEWERIVGRGPLPNGAAEGRLAGVQPWARLARAAGLGAREPLLVAFSGGADSTALLAMAALARPRPDLAALHVHHGLRGEQADGDEAFCREICARFGVPLVVRRLRLEPGGADLEARARRERYRALLAEARRTGRTVLTAHHADDARETAWMHWLRGTDPAVFAGARAELEFLGEAPGEAGPRLAPVRVVRPLLGLGHGELVAWLAARGLGWREDESNRAPGRTRAGVRHGLLPALSGGAGGEHGPGADAEDPLVLLARGAAELSRDLGLDLAALGAAATASGGRLERSLLAALPEALRRRALAQWIAAHSGRIPHRTRLAALARLVAAPARGRQSLPGGWGGELGATHLELSPPDSPAALGAPTFPLAVPGEVRLPDGRGVCARLLRVEADRPAPRGSDRVELDARALAAPLTVRFPRPGDRFHPLGGPGSRPLVRFLRDAGVPRGERARVPLVFAGDELLWVAGLRPAHPRRVQPGSTLRLELSSLEQGGKMEPGTVFPPSAG